MTRRSVKIGFLALVVTALVGGAALTHRSAHAWGHKGKAAIMKRIVSAHIDEVLDDAKVSDAQRQAIYGARDRVFTAFENQRGTHRAHLEEALQLFEADRVDANKLQSLRTQREAETRQLADVVTQSLTEVHDVLTPQQRRVVTDHIRSFRNAHAD
jgi:Spy/CpxP family protein refolding chaperone